MPNYKPCIVIPVFNHQDVILDTLGLLRKYAIPCLVIDDGSDENCRLVLQRIAGAEPWVKLHRRDRNGGKGAAIKDALGLARQQGYSHALQIDADGQHNTDDIPRFLLMAEKNPGSMICGYPIFDESVPKIRLVSRYLTHVWVWINTLSLEIKDSMCGFRVYPVEIATDCLQAETVGNRMEFDTEILVRLYWRKVPVIQMPTRVHYPTGGISHFRLALDNYLISIMHTRLFFGMLRRLPSILSDRNR